MFTTSMSMLTVGLILVLKEFKDCMLFKFEKSVPLMR